MFDEQKEINYHWAMTRRFVWALYMALIILSTVIGLWLSLFGQVHPTAPVIFLVLMIFGLLAGNTGNPRYK